MQLLDRHGRPIKHRGVPKTVSVPLSPARSLARSFRGLGAAGPLSALAYGALVALRARLSAALGRARLTRAVPAAGKEAVAALVAAAVTAPLAAAGALAGSRLQAVSAAPADGLAALVGFGGADWRRACTEQLFHGAVGAALLAAAEEDLRGMHERWRPAAAVRWGLLAGAMHGSLGAAGAAASGTGAGGWGGVGMRGLAEGARWAGAVVAMLHLIFEGLPRPALPRLPLLPRLGWRRGLSGWGGGDRELLSGKGWRYGGRLGAFEGGRAVEPRDDEVLVHDLPTEREKGVDLIEEDAGDAAPRRRRR